MGLAGLIITLTKIGKTASFFPYRDRPEMHRERICSTKKGGLRGGKDIFE
jgi:hypothetical protein